MKKIIMLIVSIVMLFTLTSCAISQEVKDCANTVKIYKSDLKDPDSLKIYGDISLITFSSGNKVYVVNCDAKNSYGAYNGSDYIELVQLSNKWYYFTPNDDYYLSAYMYVNLVKDTGINPTMEKDGFVIKTINGKQVANELGCYYSE